MPVENRPHIRQETWYVECDRYVNYWNDMNDQWINGGIILFLCLCYCFSFLCKVIVIVTIVLKLDRMILKLDVLYVFQELIL